MGEAQFAEYKHRIDKALRGIADNPQIGHSKYGRMVYHAGRHRIFFRVQGSTIYVLRILHERMDATRHLEDSRPSS